MDQPQRSLPNSGAWNEKCSFWVLKGAKAERYASDMPAGVIRVAGWCDGKGILFLGQAVFLPYSDDASLGIGVGMGAF